MKHLYMMLKLACFLDFLPLVTDLLLVEHLLSGTSYIYNAPFSIRNIEIKMKNLSLFTDIFYIIFP